MPKLFQDLFILTLIMTVSCLDATKDNVTPTMEMSISIITSTSTSIRTSIIEENALPSAIVTMQDDGILKNLSHASSPSLSPSPSSDTVWECPNITKAGVECSCDFPHTLRCTGDRTALQVITAGDCH